MTEENGIQEDWDGIIEEFADEDFNPVNPFATETLGELLQTGWDWGYDKWGTTDYPTYTMSEDTISWLRPRINKKIDNRFYFRDLGTTPVARWNKLFLSHLTSELDQLGPLYEIIRLGIDLADGGIKREKEIDVLSDFPQARLLMEQEDYASSSVENYKEANQRLPQLDQLLKYTKQYTELDEMILQALSIKCFSQFIRPTNF